jgi:hypothetical protein
MTTTFGLIYDKIYANPDLEKQVVVACCMVADSIIREDSTITNHEARLRWAQAVIANPTLVARKMMPTLAVNAVIQSGTYTDSDIHWLIAESVNQYALVI